MQPSVAKKVAQRATVGCISSIDRNSLLYCGALNVWWVSGAVRRRWFFVAAIVGALLLAAVAEAESEFANPGSIEGVVTKAGGARLEGVEVCAFDVAEDEEFTECAASKSNGAYEINGLDEGPYRVEFKSGESGVNLATQYWKGAATAAKATILRVEESHTITGINAEMKVATVTTGVLVAGVLQPDVDGDGFGDETQDGCPQSAAFHGACPTVSFAPGYSVGANSIQVKVRASATTPVAVTGASPGPGILKATEKAARGAPTTVRVPIPHPLAARLGDLPPSKSVRLRLRAHATAVDGLPSTAHLTVRLPGRG